MRRANYEIVEDSSAQMIIRDLGPWDQFLTVTNAAEVVVIELSDQLKGRRLFYYDSDGALDELVVVNGLFAGFGPRRI